MNEQKKSHVRKKEKAKRDYINSFITGTFEGIAQLSEEAIQTVLKHSCSACSDAARSFITCNFPNEYDFEKPDLDAFIRVMERMHVKMDMVPISIKMEGNIIHYYCDVGHCVCNFISQYRLIKPFPGMCLCSVASLKEMFEAAAQRPVKVEAIETCLTGGNRCYHRIEVL